jgi:hypothetical protein
MRAPLDFLIKILSRFHHIFEVRGFTCSPDFDDERGIHWKASGVQRDLLKNHTMSDRECFLN